MTKEEKQIEICKIARKLKIENDILLQAFDVTKIATSEKGYANCALATVGDAAIRLYLTKILFSPRKTSEEITAECNARENNGKLAEFGKRFTDFVYGEKVQESDELKNDPATLFEAIIGAIFLQLGYKKTIKIIQKKFNGLQ